MKQQGALLTGCIAGADHVDNIEAQLKEVGIENISIEIRPESKQVLHYILSSRLLRWTRKVHGSGFLHIVPVCLGDCRKM